MANKQPDDPYPMLPKQDKDKYHSLQNPSSSYSMKFVSQQLNLKPDEPQSDLLSLAHSYSKWVKQNPHCPPHPFTTSPQIDEFFSQHKTGTPFKASLEDLLSVFHERNTTADNLPSCGCCRSDFLNVLKKLFGQPNIGLGASSNDYIENDIDKDNNQMFDCSEFFGGESSEIKPFHVRKQTVAPVIKNKKGSKNSKSKKNNASRAERSGHTFNLEGEREGVCGGKNTNTHTHTHTHTHQI